jgi:ectoine hydroxylase-related dioxygenase (phytanoyl-CoA dioxygenase family)
MDMATALAELGVTEATLDAETAERLDRDGYAPLPGVLDGAQVEAIRARLAGLMAAEGDQAGIEVHQEAGTVVVFNSHLWHGGTQNRSDRPRRAVHSYFTRRGHGQQLDQKKYIRPQTLTALSPAARFVLDVA